MIAEWYIINLMPDIPQNTAPNVPIASAEAGQEPQNSDVKSIADILYMDHLLTKEQYESIKVRSANSNQSPLSIVRDLHIVTEEKISEALAKFLGIPYVSLSTVSFSPQAISFLPKAVIERFSLIPFAYDEENKTLSVAMANPIDLDAIAFIRQKTGLTIKTFAASSDEVKS